jgi:hypothetical protein
MSAVPRPLLQVVPRRRCLRKLTPKELALLTSMHAATIDGFRQVYGVIPESVHETWAGGELVAVEALGAVDA